MSEARRLAAIDIGTVTTRLLVADVSAGRIQEVERSVDITHLGAGLAETGALDDEAVRRVVEVVDGYAARMQQLGVERFRAVATSASRDASNGPELAARLADRGVAVEIIEGAEEAALTFEGATLDAEGKAVLVVDIGGGSTELILGEVRTLDGVRTTDIEAARSFDVGSRRLTDRFVASDPPTGAELDLARAHTVELVRPFFDGLRSRPEELRAVAGTATTLAAIESGMAHYDPEVVHGTRISGSQLAEVLGELALLPLARRREVVGLHPGRAPVIVAGLVILEVVLALSGLDEVVVSEHDILHGILLRLAEEDA